MRSVVGFPMRARLPLLLLGAALLFGACRPPDADLQPEETVEVPAEGEVVVYVETPRSLTGPLLKMIADRSGMTVQAVYQEDAPDQFLTRLHQEAVAGRADVFLGNGSLTAVGLAREGLATPYRAARARPVPPQYHDPGFRWLGYAGNPRVIAYNRDLIDRSEAPESLDALFTGPWAGKAAMTRPTLGSSAFQAAALISRLGDERGVDFYRKAAAAGNRLVDGDAEVRRLVASGEVAWGVLDFDQATLAGREAQPVGLRIPDGLGYGAVVVPHVAMLLRGAPHPAQARGCIDRLFGGNVTRMLGESDNALLTFLPIVSMGIKKPEWLPLLGALNVLPVDNEQAFDAFARHREFLAGLGARPSAP
ncbi:MAG TPA: ABC transporter substrate-binding protein [Dongiaceae bacterium]|nr:ABC transporter substrate-binding protein [Dongiaceae bacterium]